MSELSEKCAVVGVFGPHAAELAALALKRLDHRGPDGTGVGGIAADGRFEVFHAPGRAQHVLSDERIAELDKLGLVAAVAHGRYPTSGEQGIFQPIRHGRILFAENGNTSNLAPIRADLFERGIDTGGMNDSQMNAAAIGDRVRRGASVAEAIADVEPLLIGGHSCVVVGRDRDGSPLLAAWRERHGIRPLVWGRTPGGGYIFASETVGLDAAGALYGGEVTPGTLVTVSAGGIRQYELAPAEPKFDPFEIIYFSNKDSLFKGQRIGDLRAALGRRLAAECGHDTHPQALVIGIPNSAKPYARGYANALGLDCGQDVLRKHTDERTFLGGTATHRANLRDKIYDLDAATVRGRRTALIDDSLLRNNTAPHVTRLMLDAGARSVDVLICSPPIYYPNFYGINTPAQDDLVASVLRLDQIRDQIGCRRLTYLSLQGMTDVFQDLTGEPAEHFELSCFTGEYPVDIGDHTVRHHLHGTLARIA